MLFKVFYYLKKVSKRFNEDSPEVYFGSIAKNQRRKLETMVEELNPFASSQETNLD